MAATGSPKPRREGRMARHLRVAREVRAEPRRAVGLVREGLLGIWRARGGGFFGLGYLIAFLVLEVRMFFGEVSESSGFAEYLASQALQYVFRFTVQSLVNALLAFIWPVYVLEWLGAWGLAVLGGGYLLFEKALRPVVEAWFPELRVAAPEADSSSEQ